MGSENPAFQVLKPSPAGPMGAEREYNKGMMTDILEAEDKYFQSNKNELLAHHNGKYVLIKDSKFIGAFDSPELAYNTALETFGVIPVFIKKVEKEDFIHSIPSITSGAIGAGL